MWKNGEESYTARAAADYMMETIYNQFVKNGIGVVIGEYGLLGYDASEGCLETGEELKYYEYMNEIARENGGVCLVFWDNGSGINRKDTTNYSWKKPEVGALLEASMTGRSSYATGSDNLYFKEEVAEDVNIPLTLNGNTFTGIEGLTEGTDYTYDSESATVTLKKEYVNSMFAKATGYGTFATLVMKFSSGADWHEYLIKYTTPVIKKAEGTTTDGIKIPVTFNGSRVRRVTAYQPAGKAGPNSDWWDYLQYDGSFGVDYEKGTFNLLSDFFADATVKTGLMKVKVEFYDGQIVYIWLTVNGTKVSSNPEVEVATDDIGASEIICLYAGETAIPEQYLYMPEGGSVYGSYLNEQNGMVTLDGWPAKLIFDTKAYDDFITGGIVLYYMDIVKYIDVSFGIKNAPTVDNIDNLEVDQSAKLTVNNLADDAKVTYKSSNTSVATVNADGEVTGKGAGKAEIIVTVEQYNRTDDFKAVVKVAENVLAEDVPESGVPEGLWIAGIDEEGYIYTGKAIKPEVRVYDGETRLKAGQDYTITYKNNVKANDASKAKTAPTVVVKGKGNYSGQETATFKILQVDLSDSSISASNVTVAYKKNQVQKKVPTVTFNGKKLTNKKDFTVSYPAIDEKVKDACKAPGEYDIVLTGKGNFTGTKTVKLIITETTLISTASVKSIASQSYTGSAIEPKPVVTLKGDTLKEGTDYELSYANNTEAGTATITLTGIGNFTGTKKVTFKIVDRRTSIKNAKVNGIKNIVYNGTEQTLDLEVKLNKQTLTVNEDYEVTYTNNTNAGKATVTIKGIGKYKGTIKKTFKITAYDLKKDTDEKFGGLEEDIQVKYLKSGCKPEVTLTYGDVELVTGKDYTISYKNNKAVTTNKTRKNNYPTIVIKGKGNFTGTVTKTFTIKAKTFDDAKSPVTITVPDIGATTSGKYASKPVLTDADGKKLTAGKDYESKMVYTLEDGTVLSSKNCKKLVKSGVDIKVTVQGKGAYMGTIDAVFHVANKDFNKASITINSKEYTGEAVTLDASDFKQVKVGKDKLTYGEHYEIVEGSYTNNVNKGTASVTIVGKGEYGGTKTVKFKITQKKVSWFWRLFE